MFTIVLGQTKTSQYLGGPETQPITDPVEKNKAIWLARNTAARMLGKLSAFIVEPLPDIVYTDVMETPLQMFLNKVCFEAIFNYQRHTCSRS